MHSEISAVFDLKGALITGGLWSAGNDLAHTRAEEAPVRPRLSRYNRDVGETEPPIASNPTKRALSTAVSAADS